MKISVAGQDRTQDLGPALRRQAELMARGDSSCQPAKSPACVSALALAQAKSDTEYLDELLRLLRYRDGVDTLPFHIPSRPGLCGRLLVQVKKVLWKLLRYQHDRIAFRQNLINTQLLNALEFECTQRQKETADLRQRVVELEKQGGGKA